MAVLFLMTVLFTLGAFAVRRYWFVRSLGGGANEVVAELRGSQQKTISESHPRVFGVWFVEDSSDWGVVKVENSACTRVESNSFGGGVYVKEAVFDAAPGLTAECRALGGMEDAQIAFFYARGSATAGEVVLTQDQIGREKTIEVQPVTGRADQL